MNKSHLRILITLERYLMEFPGGPEVMTLHSHCLGHDSVPGQGARIPRAMWLSQKKKNTTFGRDVSEAGRHQHFERVGEWEFHRETKRRGIRAESLHSRASVCSEGST